MKLLAIDTTTEACSAALMSDGEIIEDFRVAPRQHTELILAMVDGLLQEAGLGKGELDALAFGRGPGAFTGVRIGTGVAQGIAFGLDLPVIPVSTLAALAQGALREHGCRQVLAAIDARMDEVYAAAYADNGTGVMQALSDECVCAPGEVPMLEGSAWFGAGSGWGSYESILRERFGEIVSAWQGDALPHAQDMAVLAALDWAEGRMLPAEQALPVYLRDNVAKKAAERS